MKKNPYEVWKQTFVEDLQNFGIFDLYAKDGNPQTGGWDTETTGLHIIKDKPFLVQMGWLIPKKDYGRVFMFYPTPNNMKIFFQIATKFKYFIAHNIKYDLHMVTNIGYGHYVQTLGINWTENMAVARLALEAVPEREGGDSLKLKSLGKKYVHSEASKSESIIKDDLKKQGAHRIRVLAAALKQFDLEGEFTATGKQKKWGKGAIEKFLKDPTNDVDLLPDDVREVWLDWQEEYPEPTYEDVDRELMIKYGGEDIITMLEFFKSAFKFVLSRRQLPVLQLEMDCILPTYRMERIGMKADMNYLEESRVKVQSYIRKLRNELYELVGEKVTVNQHARIKQLYADKWGIRLDGSDSKAMSDILDETGRGEAYEKGPKRLAFLVKSLRTLEKWYSTYIKRLMKNASYDGNVYTQINLNSAVSGRMSSDLQQNPKEAIFDEHKNELFHPRKAFVINKDMFDFNAYIDYSQVELRVSADYTIKVSGGDLNLCRAYMPFKCTHYKTGEPYQYKELNDRKRWSELREGYPQDHEEGMEGILKEGWSVWLVPETNEFWIPTDMHSETTHNALLELKYECVKKYEHYTHKVESAPFGALVDKKLFKKLRGTIGKRFNFSKTYGVGLATAMKNLNVTQDVALALIKGYEAAFPGLIAYQKAIEVAHHKKGYVHNAYGMRYYMSDRSKSYKLANHVVQGSCATALKRAIIELDAYILQNNLKSRLILPVHDEQIFGMLKNEKEHIPKLIAIMQNVFNSWCLVPIVSEPELSYTTWAQKEELTL